MWVAVPRGTRSQPEVFSLNAAARVANYVLTGMRYPHWRHSQLNDKDPMVSKHGKILPRTDCLIALEATSVDERHRKQINQVRA
jgi:hypothetical protein